MGSGGGVGEEVYGGVRWCSRGRGLEWGLEVEQGERCRGGQEVDILGVVGEKVVGSGGRLKSGREGDGASMKPEGPSSPYLL